MERLAGVGSTVDEPLGDAGITLRASHVHVEGNDPVGLFGIQITVRTRMVRHVNSSANPTDYKVEV